MEDRLFSLACLILLHQEPTLSQFLLNPSSHIFSCKSDKASCTVAPIFKCCTTTHRAWKELATFILLTRLPRNFPSVSVRCIPQEIQHHQYARHGWQGYRRQVCHGRYYHDLPYATKSGQSLTFIIGTVPNVSLNGLVHLPWIQKVGAIFDPMNQVIECKLLDMAPFPITSMLAQFSVP